MQRLARTEGILCALETAHAIAALESSRRACREGAVIVVGLSGRGDKDMATIAQRAGGATREPHRATRSRALRAERTRKALVVYLTASAIRIVETSRSRDRRGRVDAGADVIELGVPFSDPSADGPSIQRAMERALDRRRGGMRSALDVVPRAARGDSDADRAVRLLQPDLRARRRAASPREARDAGVDGVLSVDSARRARAS